MIVVVGATGNIGSKLAEKLLARKERVRIVARSKEKTKLLADQGAEIALASLDDATALANIFRGADGVFILIPPAYSADDFRKQQNIFSEAITKALRDAGVPVVVNLSSLGAHKSSGGGPINGLYDHEQRLNSLATVNILHLRPTYFMENLLMNVGLIKNSGLMGGPLRPDLKIPMIATVDIAEEAAERLTKRDVRGHAVKELWGERDLSMNEIATVLGRAIEKPGLRYVPFSYEDTEKAMVAMGLSPDAARLMIEMNRTINDHGFPVTQSRSDATTTPTSIETFARTFAAIYRRS